MYLVCSDKLKIMAYKGIKCTESNLVHVRREVLICSKIGKERYIAQFAEDVAWDVNSSSVLLYMDFYPGGDLNEIITLCEARSTTVHPFVATAWVLEISRAVMACHQHDLIHRDIKPMNGKKILLNSKKGLLFD